MIYAGPWVPKGVKVQFVAASPIVPPTASVGVGLVYAPAYTALIRNAWCYVDQADPLLAAGGASTLSIGMQAVSLGGGSATGYGAVFTTAYSIPSLNLGRVLASTTAGPETIACPDDGANRGARTVNLFCDAGSVTGTLYVFWEELRRSYPAL